MPDTVEIQPSGPLHATIRPPGSKSITLRALVCAALAEGESLLIGALDCDDTQSMICALCTLGITIERDPSGETIRVVGCGGRLPVGDCPDFRLNENGTVPFDATAEPREFFAADSGATARFLTALLALGRGTYRIDGSPRMRERPMSGLLDALGQLGAKAVSQVAKDRLPLVVYGRGLRGGHTTVAGNI
jgi:3-phosphoshikimate 1-carboxyvinyltransferase